MNHTEKNMTLCPYRLSKTMICSYSVPCCRNVNEVNTKTLVIGIYGSDKVAVHFIHSSFYSLTFVIMC